MKRLTFVLYSSIAFFVIIVVAVLIIFTSRALTSRCWPSILKLPLLGLGFVVTDRN